MRTQIIQATIEAIFRIRNPRFLRTERGYHGKFYCELQAALDQMGFPSDMGTLEMEYQKSAFVHHMTQRPDIVLHMPRELTNAPPQANNYAVWALKHQAAPKAAMEDFVKLDQMFSELNYPLGIFINVASETHHLGIYSGQYKDRLVALSVIQQANGLIITQAQYDGDERIIEIRYG